MSMKVIDELRKELDNALAAEKVDKNEVLRLSVELDKYIVEYMRARVLSRKINRNNKNHD